MKEVLIVCGFLGRRWGNCNNMSLQICKCELTDVRAHMYISVFSSNKGKHWLEKTPYLDTFHAVQKCTCFNEADRIISFDLNAPPFLYPWKHDSRKVFWCFQGIEKRCIGNKWFNTLTANYQYSRSYRENLPFINSNNSNANILKTKNILLQFYWIFGSYIQF